MTARDVEASIRFRNTSEGGRAAPCFNGYRGQFHYDDGIWDAVQEYPDKGSAEPGETVRAYLHFSQPAHHDGRVVEGMAFTVQEGPRVESSSPWLASHSRAALGISHRLRAWSCGPNSTPASRTILPSRRSAITGEPRLPPEPCGGEVSNRVQGSGQLQLCQVFFSWVHDRQDNQGLVTYAPGGLSANGACAGLTTWRHPSPTITS